MADDYDFQIDTLKFRAAISDEFPYLRETAPFRKDQYDTTQAPGDQSLEGWWTRGQLSFHQGQGIDFYEVQAVDAIERFKTGSAVHPWDAGKVTLSGDNTSATQTGLHTNQFNRAVVYNDNIWYTSGGELRRNATVVQFSSFPTDSVVSGAALVGDTTKRIYASADDRVEYISASNTTSTVMSGTAIVNGNYVSGSPDEIRGGIWYAKNRIWLATEFGNWYNVPYDTSATVNIPSGGGAYLFWSRTSGSAYGSGFSGEWLCESPGLVYIGNGSQYLFGVDADPTGVLAPPTVVGDMGAGAIVRQVHYCLGRLVIATQDSIHVAQILPDGSLVIGPAFITGLQGNITQMCDMHGRVFFAAVAEGDDLSVSVFEVDVLNDLEGRELEPAWCIRHRGALSTTFNTNRTWCITNSGSNPRDYDFVVMTAGNDTANLARTQRFKSYSSTGHLYTAQHRLGTLEDKKWYSVRVTAKVDSSSSGQSVQVYSVTKEGTEALLGTMSTDGTNSEIFSLTGLAASESIGFKFVLNRGSTTTSTPELLGYQIKALPVPTRQRILKWPVLIQDKLRLRRGTSVGKDGKAFSDIDALETLERDQSVVTFTDHRTGETGTAYIDSVQMQGDTPPTASGDGFGGVAYITLRVLP